MQKFCFEDLFGSRFSEIKTDKILTKKLIANYAAKECVKCISELFEAKQNGSRQVLSA